MVRLPDGVLPVNKSDSHSSKVSSKLLDFSDLGQLTFCINRTLGVSCYIRRRPNSYTHARGLRRRCHVRSNVELGWLSGLELVLVERWSWVRIPLDL